MKYALVDVGSNSMRLSVYEIEDGRFQILFKEKIMAGLAGHVEKGRLTETGIYSAVSGISHFLKIVQALGIGQCHVFATASLRNVSNTDEAREQISRQTACKLEVLTGEEEALYGYYGAMYELQTADGVFVDIGGGSTEVVQFADGKPFSVRSYPLGSLKLYRDCVKKILPGKKPRARMEGQIMQELLSGTDGSFVKGRELIGVGGTVRAALKLCRQQFGLPDAGNCFSAKQLGHLCMQLSGKEKDAAGIILKIVPERIHTLVPGLMILQKIVQLTGAAQIVVSRYGVREGYLCQQILNKTPENTAAPRTGS